MKPENLLIGQDGYIRLTDFGISKLFDPENGNDTSGTPGYMAPEVMLREAHGVAADYYGLGICLYELVEG